MDLDANWHRSDFAVDVYKELITEEKRLLPYLHNQPEGEHANRDVVSEAFRRLAIDHDVRGPLPYGKTKPDQFSFSMTTVHLAMYLFDCFVDRYHLKPERVLLVIVVTLIIAAKIEEQDLRQPKPASLLNRCQAYARSKAARKESLTAFNRYEITILQLCDFRLLLPTAPLFVPYFLSVCIDRQDLYEADGSRIQFTPRFIERWLTVRKFFDNEHWSQMTVDPCSSRNATNSRHKDYTRTDSFFGFDVTMIESFMINDDVEMFTHNSLMQCLQQICCVFLDLSLEDIRMRLFAPSLVAAACVMATRHVCALPRIWHHRLQMLSGYTDRQLEPCEQILYRKFDCLFGPQVQPVASPPMQVFAPVLPSVSRSDPIIYTSTPVNANRLYCDDMSVSNVSLAETMVSPCKGSLPDVLFTTPQQQYNHNNTNVRKRKQQFGSDHNLVTDDEYDSGSKRRCERS